jgi:hypothetical protein
MILKISLVLILVVKLAEIFEKECKEKKQSDIDFLKTNKMLFKNC